MQTVSEPDDPNKSLQPPSFLISVIAKMRSVNRRFITYFIAGSLGLDAMVVVVGGFLTQP